MVKPNAKVLLLHLLQRDTVVIQHCLIYREYGSIGSRHLYEGRDGVYCQAQIALAVLRASSFNVLSIAMLAIWVTCAIRSW